MANNNKQTGLVKLFPDWPIFRRLASAAKIKATMRDALSAEEIKRGESGHIQEIVEECKNSRSAAYRKRNEEIDQLFNSIPAYKQYSKDRLEKVRLDILFCYFAYGFTPSEYFAFRLETKPANERKEFISSRLRMIYRCKMNNILKAELFNDKAKTYAFYKSYFHREAVAIESQSDYQQFDDFVTKYPVFVKKAVFEAQGNSVELIDINQCGKTKKELFDELLAVGKHILEEKIEQTQQLGMFNKSSVNTVRAITFNTKHGIVVPYCVIRTGAPGSFVDNAGAGGVSACIDFETGTIYTDGFDEMGGVFAEHPATGLKMKGYQLPDWSQLQELVKDAAKKVPQIQFVGWDLAHTKDGWIIVEGNENCYVVAQQMIMDKGMRTAFEDVMKDMKLYA